MRKLFRLETGYKVTMNRHKFVIHKDVMKRLEKKWPGFRKEVDAEFVKLRAADKTTVKRRRSGGAS